MSLLDDFARTCIIMDKTRKPDGEGGYITTWAEGAKFTNHQALDTSMDARIAEQQGVASVYSALVSVNVPIEYGDVFKDSQTGHYFKVTSRPEEKQAPKSASFALKYFTAERTELSQ